MNIPDSACRSIGIVTKSIEYDETLGGLWTDFTFRNIKEIKSYVPHTVDGIEIDFLNLKSNQDVLIFCQKYGLFHAYEALVFKIFFDMVIYGIKVTSNPDDEQELNKIISNSYKEAIKVMDVFGIDVPLGAYCEWKKRELESGITTEIPELHITFNLFENDIEYVLLVYDAFTSSTLAFVRKPSLVVRKLEIPISAIKFHKPALLYSEIAVAVTYHARKLREMVKNGNIDALAKKFFSRSTWEITKNKNLKITIPGLYQAILWRMLGKATKGFFELKECKHCNRLFIPNRKTQIYCSLTCQKKAKAQRSYQRRKSQQ